MIEAHEKSETSDSLSLTQMQKIIHDLSLKAKKDWRGRFCNSTAYESSFWENIERFDEGNLVKTIR